MLDGRVLEASQVEYKPFGKPPLQREMIIFQKPFPGAARTELESQLQRAVKVSAKAKHVKCKMDSSSGTPPATACRAPRSSRAAGAARLWRPGTCG